MRIGSLFTGYGGLDMAVGGDLAWYCEIEPAACRVLAAHHPGVRNLGDITAVDWSRVEPVDVLTGGYPCQPFSHAGKRKGTNDERHLWPFVRDAIRHLGPRLVVLENVRGHLTLGFDVVLADLADLGLSARWGVVRASDAGAPHQRARLFIAAYPGGGSLSGSAVGVDGLLVAGERGGPAEYAEGKVVGQRRGDRQGSRIPRGADSAVAADRESIGRPQRRAGDAERPGAGRRPAGGRDVAADAGRERHGRREDARVVGGVGSPAAVSGRATSSARKVAGDRGAAVAADADLTGSQARRAEPGRATGQPAAGQRESTGRDAATSGVDWGQYAAAIERWERVLGRRAPAPTVLGSTGKPRLSPAFVEWMMGLPEGHVTGHGLSNAQALKMLGNGVVPQQARLALDLLGVAA